MRNFLPSTFFSQSSRQNESVARIMHQERPSAAEVEELLQRVESIADKASFLARHIRFNSVITNVETSSIIRDFNNRVKELYSESDSISSLIQANASDLSFNLEKQKKQLSSFAKFITDFSFMLEDDSFYDGVFVESFVDELNREQENIESMLHDRDGSVFPVEAQVDGFAGNLTMGLNFLTNVPLVGRYGGSNCLSLVNSDTGIEKALDEDLAKGWRLSIKSDRVISSSIYPGINKGAQLELLLEMQTATVVNIIRLAPLADIPVEILSIKAYDVGNGGNVYRELVNEPIVLDRNLVLNFESTTVDHFKIVINQPVYTRGRVSPHQKEVNYVEAAKWLAEEHGSKTEELRDISDAALLEIYNKSLTVNPIYQVTPKANTSKFSENGAVAHEVVSKKSLSRSSGSGGAGKRVFKQWMRDKIGSDLSSSSSRFAMSELFVDNTASSVTDLSEADPGVLGDYNSYIYKLGLKSIQVGTIDVVGESVFVSKPVPMRGQSGEVKIKVDDVNFFYSDSNLDDIQVTSVEYSVTNVDNPSKESDWVPIHPSNEADQYTYERLFFNEARYAVLRFPTNLEGATQVFKNGYLAEADQLSLVRSSSGQIVGVRYTGTVKEDDIFTVSYLPAPGASVVNFADKGFRSNILASASSDVGPGERFDGLGGSLVVALSQYPYVDHEAVVNYTSYSVESGLSGQYMPVSVVLQDGTIATNFTNYKGLVQPALDAEAPLSYIHSGRQIVFNKTINQPFVIYYQYEPSYLRYRIVLRSTHPDQVSPIVSDITIKSKLNASLLGLNEKKV